MHRITRASPTNQATCSQATSHSATRPRLLSGDRPMPLPVEHLPDRLPRAHGVLAADHAGGNPTDGVENEIMVLAGSGTALWAEKIGVCPIAPADCIVP